MTRLSRRNILIGAPALIASGGLSMTSTVAQESVEAYPSRDVKFVCAFPPGSGADVYVRFFAERMRPVMKRNIIVENRAGAIGNLATLYTARSKPDGYTQYVHAPSALAANMHLFKAPPVDVAKEVEVIGTICRMGFMLTVHKNSPVNTVPELVDSLRKKGNKASYGTTAPPGKVAGAWFNKAFGLTPVEVNYKTGVDTMNDMANGTVDYVVHDPIHAISYKDSLKILAVTNRERLKVLPDLPTLSEQGAPGLNAPSWWGSIVPVGMPRPLVDKINRMWREAVATEEMRTFLAKFGADTLSISPQEATAQLVQEVKDWAEYVKMANIEPMG
jgi:tripartite-type tricarboxylate transporter receptor subunit TctC